MLRRGTAACLAAAAISLGAAHAQTPADTDRPDWLRQPTAEDVQSVLPVGARGSGEARIRCRVAASGLLTDCAVVAETPAGQGFGAAALALAPRFQMRPRTVDGRPVDGDSVIVPIRWRGEPNTAGATAALMARPRFTAAPTRAEVAAAAPETPGLAVMRCRADAEGRLRRCRVISERPTFAGLERAAVSLADRFRVVVPPGAAAARGDLLVDVPVALSRTPPESFAQPPFTAGADGDAIAAALQPLAQAAPDRRVRVVSDCLIGPGGALTDCRVSSGPAEAQGPVAPVLAGFVAAPWTADGQPTVGARTRVALSYVDEGEPPAADALIERPLFDRSAPPPAMASYYPEQARRGRLSGGAVVECRAEADGRLTACRAVAEAPQGAGFGEAAVRMASALRLQPNDADGRPVAGRRYRTTIRFAPS